MSLSVDRHCAIAGLHHKQHVEVGVYVLVDDSASIELHQVGVELGTIKAPDHATRTGKGNLTQVGHQNFTRLQTLIHGACSQTQSA